MMTDLLGKPSPEVIERVSNQRARSFLHAMPYKAPRPFESKFRNADRQALDLLQQMLSFDHAERPTAAQALNHPYFNGLPKVAPVETSPINVEQFEFELQGRLTEADVRDLIYREILNYHPNVSALYMPGSCRLPSAMSQFDHDKDDVKGQFLAAERSLEQRSSQSTGAGPHPACSTGVAFKLPPQQYYGGVHPAGAGVLQQHVPAYRPAADPTAMAAAMALAAVQEQQALAAMQYQNAAAYYAAAAAAAAAANGIAAANPNHHTAAAISAAAAAMASQRASAGVYSSEPYTASGHVLSTGFG